MVSEVPDGSLFAVIDRSEQIVAFARRLRDATDFAERMGTVYVDAPMPAEGVGLRLAANAVVGLGSSRVRRAPEEALRAVYAAMGLKGSEPIVSMQQVQELSSEEAHRRLVPLFPKLKVTKAGKASAIKAYNTPASMAENLIGQNYKTAKGTPEEIIDLIREDSAQIYGEAFSNASVKGLSILPHTTSYTDPNVAEIRDEMMNKIYGVERVLPIRLQSCTKATPECAKSCLVFSGNNLADDYNTVKKYSLLQSLITEPVAFCRMLVDAIQMHRDRCIRNKTMPLVRLNVFSDLPWELMFPDLFEHFDHDNFVQFYDYTKVPGRITPRNYDLTFSFAGAERSADDMEHEINRQRRRVAVVFARVGQRAVMVEPGQRQKFEVPLKPPPGSQGIPSRIWGLDVIDGDVSDMRPFDPSPSVVALRWKIPANQGVTLVDADAFVVKGTMVDGQFVLAETPRFTLDYSAEAV